MQTSEAEVSIRNHIDRIEVLSDIYHDLSEKRYANRAERDVARLKMELVKKEMLLLNYLINKDVELI